jgi:hypothetical protein
MLPYLKDCPESLTTIYHLFRGSEEPSDAWVAAGSSVHLEIVVNFVSAAC